MSRYLEDLVEACGFIIFALYGIVIIVGLIVVGIAVIIIGLAGIDFEEYWYVGIIMAIGGFFLLPTIGRVCDITIEWKYKVKRWK